LYIATQNASPELVAQLIEAKADVNEKSSVCELLFLVVLKVTDA
jgi:hypothetical protein